MLCYTFFFKFKNKEILLNLCSFIPKIYVFMLWIYIILRLELCFFAQNKCFYSFHVLHLNLKIMNFFIINYLKFIKNCTSIYDFLSLSLKIMLYYARNVKLCLFYMKYMKDMKLCFCIEYLNNLNNNLIQIFILTFILKKNLDIFFRFLTYYIHYVVYE